MTDIKKKQAGKMPLKARKLRLHKETLKDLSAKKEASPKGGVRNACTFDESGC
jgi:hypothetical protein